MLVAGIDSSTQSTKVLLCQATMAPSSGSQRPASGRHECDPELWWEALVKAGAGLLDRATRSG